MAYEAIIGMEVHAQILSASKMFCGCSSDYASAPPNTHTCPVCLAMPGVLPVINEHAVECTLLTGLALNCEIPAFSKFDRKNYAYPDLPKGYQISQYDYPFCVNGYLTIEVDGLRKDIRVRRVHLEEDTAKLTHEPNGSLIDFNRAGVPLMEIVTEADIRSGDEAYAYLTQLRSILRYLGVCTGNMEEGAMRCEANVSLRPVGASAFGTKVEVKNLNSFRAVRGAIAYEIERQARVLDEGGEVEQVTMGWDETHHRTVFQRSKEYAEDYRYFPEPDLPPMDMPRERVERIAATLPELPETKKTRFVAEYGLSVPDAGLLVAERTTAAWFERAVAAAEAVDVAPRIVANWVTGELFRMMSESGVEIDAIQISPQELAELLGLMAKGTINATVAKEVLAEMASSGASAQEIVAAKGLTQISDEDRLAALVNEVIDANPNAVADYAAGKQQAMGFLIGQIMRATRGQANVQVVRPMLIKALDARTG